MDEHSQAVVVKVPSSYGIHALDIFKGLSPNKPVGLIPLRLVPMEKCSQVEVAEETIPSGCGTQKQDDTQDPSQNMEIPLCRLRLVPDSQTLVSGSWDRTIRLWDPRTGQEKKTLTSRCEA